MQFVRGEEEEVGAKDTSDEHAVSERSASCVVFHGVDSPKDDQRYLKVEKIIVVHKCWGVALFNVLLLVFIF